MWERIDASTNHRRMRHRQKCKSNNIQDTSSYIKVQPPYRNERTIAEYWNHIIDRLHKRYRTLRKIYQRTVDQQLRTVRLQEYRTAKKEFKCELFNAKLKSWEQYVNEQLVTDPWGVPYKIVMSKIKAPDVMSTIQKSDVTRTTGWRESVTLLMDKLLPNMMKKMKDVNTRRREQNSKGNTKPRKGQTLSRKKKLERQ